MRRLISRSVAHPSCIHASRISVFSGSPMAGLAKVLENNPPATGAVTSPNAMHEPGQRRRFLDGSPPISYMRALPVAG